MVYLNKSNDPISNVRQVDAYDQGGIGQWAVYYTSLQRFMLKFFLFVGTYSFGTFIAFRLYGSGKCRNVLTSICNLQKDNFVYYDLGCKFIGLR